MSFFLDHIAPMIAQLFKDFDPKDDRLKQQLGIVHAFRNHEYSNSWEAGME
jgi:hypothetical protein